MCLFIFQCEKIRKKRSGMLGTIRIAQGNSIDDIDQRIMQARLVCPYIKNNLKKKQNNNKNTPKTSPDN